MNTYRNSIRTKNNIRKAFAELLKENKVVEKITVKDLIERADISKSTFYLHYRDIYDIIEEMENEVLDVIEEALNKAYLDNSTSFIPYLNLIFELLKNNEEQYRLIMTAKYPVLFMDKLKKMIYSKVIEDKTLTALSKNPDIKKEWGEWRDSNPRSSEPQSDALTNCAIPTIEMLSYHLER